MKTVSTNGCTTSVSYPDAVTLPILESMEAKQNAAVIATPNERTLSLAVLPYFATLPAIIGIICSYIWALINKDVPAFWPYISDAGGDPPQHNALGIGLVITGVSAMFCFLARFYIVRDIMNKTTVQHAWIINVINNVLVLAGVAIVIGMFGVALNPTGHLRRDGGWLYPLFLPHIASAGVLFSGGCGYLFFNTILTRLLREHTHDLGYILPLRVVLVFLAMIACAVTFLRFPISNLEVMKPHPDRERSYPPGTEVSTVAEWVLAGVFIAYIFTLKREFRGTQFVFCFRSTPLAAVTPENGFNCDNPNNNRTSP